MTATIQSGEGKKMDLGAPRVFFDWEIWWACNYRCSYCKFTIDGFDRNYRMDVFPGLKRLTEVWERIYALYGQCHVILSGAEPSQYPQFYDVARMLTRRHTLELHTNLSFDAERFADAVDLRRVRVAGSFHPQFAKFEEFLAKATLLRRRGISAVGVTYVAYPGQLKDMERYSRAFNGAERIGFVIHPYHGFHEGRVYPGGYTVEEAELCEAALNADTTDAGRTRLRWEWGGHPLKLPTEEAAAQARAREMPLVAAPASVAPAAPAAAEVSRPVLFELKPSAPKEPPATACSKKATMCQMGQYYGHMVPNGDVYRCCHFSSNWIGWDTRQRPEYLGNMFLDDDFKLLDAPAVCTVPICPCDKCMVVGEEDRWLDKWQSPDV